MFKVGDLIRLKDGYGSMGESRLGFIDDIIPIGDSFDVYIMMAGGDRSTWTFYELNTFFERATNIK